MNWNTNLTNLCDVLADLYPTIRDARNVVIKAGLEPKFIAFEPKALNNWFNIIEEALKHTKVQSIVDVANKDYPENEWLKLAQQNNLMTIKGPDVAQDIVWNGVIDTEQLEKLMGTQNTLLPISFLEQGLSKSHAVARVLLPNGASGTGFLITEDLLVTNNHVLPTDDVAKETIVQFNYQKSAIGLDEPCEEFHLLPQDIFFTSADDDWTVVRVQGNPGESWGMLKLTSTAPQVKD